jgi:LCP family protein required for cell wall assembly
MTMGWLRQHRKLLAWTAGGVAVLLVGVAATGYLIVRHFNNNIAQANVRGAIGKQPPDLHPLAQDVLIIGSAPFPGAGAGAQLTTSQADMIMLVHIAANKQWAEVMSIPRDSYVKIPSCQTPGGLMSSPRKSTITEAFALGNSDGKHAALGAACEVKAVEQNTGIYIDHFLVLNFIAFKGMVAALGGVEACNSVPYTDPSSGIILPAGHHLLSPDQALAYVRVVNGATAAHDLERIARQQAFVSSLISRVKSQLLHPVAIYRFLDAFTRSLTIDSQLGGITGLFHFFQTLHDIPSSKIALFTTPSEVNPANSANALWIQPKANEVFATFRNDTRASKALYTTPITPPGRPGKTGVSSVTPSDPASLPARTASQSICVP